ncbi:MAG: adenylate/guanylate cyclase domain-containing protein [Candidatus Binatia bacterium]
MMSALEIVRRSIAPRRITPVAANGAPITILFTDMEGFTQMTERLGDKRALAVVRDHNRIVRNEVATYGGTEVELQGDGFLLAFSALRSGLECAIAIQKAFAAYNQKHDEQPIRVRMGVHHGVTICEAGKFFGKTVILATRIAAQARGEEILVSTFVRDMLGATAAALRFGEPRELELHGLGGTHPVCALGWR